ncbi:MAG: hypothetical protein N3B10_05335 [Armatimonadetes bacterium]|nr:hypothetical protein [Armatimonadota bacterium]MCX7967898.1 hypothetical protein [Armatimonadota bacterium]MDW8143582.1 hypothetical protein [Armatimonadota bacterium]
MTYRGVVKGKIVELEGDPSIPEGTEVEVIVRERVRLHKGSPKLLAQVAEKEPHLTDEDVNALERAIEEGKMRIREYGVFEGEGK